MLCHKMNAVVFLHKFKLRNICFTNPTCGYATPSAHPVVAPGSWPRSEIFPPGGAKVSRIFWLHCKSRDLFSGLLVCRLLSGKLNDATIPSPNLVIYRIRSLSRNTVLPYWILCSLTTICTKFHFTSWIWNWTWEILSLFLNESSKILALDERALYLS